jgi:hypothetical protein
LLRDRPDGTRGQRRRQCAAHTIPSQVNLSAELPGMAPGRLEYANRPRLAPKTDSERSPLHDVRQHAILPYAEKRETLYLPDEPTPNATPQRWWSQTGSNRRPHACKARALPAELWPLRMTDVRYRISETPSSDIRIPSSAWWAWEDLNLRPHAYQARALTN